MNIIGTTLTDELLVTMTQAEFDSVPEPAPPTLPDGVVLDYAHVSQKGIGAAKNLNDCGAACVVSCAREHGYPNLTVDEVSADYQRPNKPMFIHEVRAALGGYRMANRFDGRLTAVSIAEHILAENLPVITLVSYHALPYHAPGYENYQYAHYVLVYGVRGNALLYHDPLSDGRELEISFPQMTVALRSEGNQPNQGILLNYVQI